MSAQTIFTTFSPKAASALFSIIILFWTLILPDASYAATGINRQINFQGKLVQGASASAPNTNVSDSTYTVIFSLYNVSSSGTALWTETQSVTTVDGIFRVALGSVTPFPANFNFNWDGLYLGMKVGADSEMTPRMQLAAVPFAFNAQTVAGLTVQDTAGNASTSGVLQVANGKTVSFGDAFTTSTGNALTLTTTGGTNVTLPTSGTLATLAGAETLTNKIIGSTGLTFTGAATDATTGTNEDFTLTPNGTGNIILTSDFNSGVSIGSSANTPGVLSISGGIGSNAGLIVNRVGTTDDILTASASGSTKFTIANNGTITLVGGNTQDIKTTGTNTLKIDTGGAATLTIGGTNQTGLTLGRSGQSTTVAGNVQAFTLAGTITGSGSPNISSIGAFSGVTGAFTTSATTPLVDNSGILGIGTTNATSLTLGKSGITTTFGSTAWTATPTISGLVTASSGLTIASAQNLTLTGVTGNNGVLYANTSGVITAVSATSTASQCLLSGLTTAAPSWGSCPGGGSTAWSSIAVPTANLSLAMSTNTTTFNYATGTSTNNLFSLTTDASANGTGSLFNVQTGTSSTLSPLRVRAGSSESLYVKSDGNVGIGTTTPTASLHIDGLASAHPSLELDDNSHDIGYASGDSLTFGTWDGSNWIENMRLSANGQLGLGVNPTGFFHVSGTVTGKALTMLNDTGTDQNILVGSASGTTKFTFDRSGNLGLATGGSVDTLVAGALGFGNANANAVTLSNSGATTTINGSGLTINPTSWTATPTISGLLTASSGITISAAKTLTLGAGNTSNAPLKFTSGTNLLAAAAGAMEWDGTNLYITQTSGPTRKTLAYLDSSITGSAGSVLFANVGAGTNANALVIGTGGSLGVSGSGTINATTLGGATFAAPGAIGGTTPGTGAFTSLSANATSTGLTLSGAGTAIAFSGAGLAQITTASNQNLALMPGGTGNVGIGTTTPLAQLDMVGKTAGVTVASISAATGVNITADLMTITTGNHPVTTAGVNGLAINYTGGAANVESAASRIDFTPGSTSGGIWNGFRFVANTTGPVSGVTENGLKVEGPTTGGAGSYNAITINNLATTTSGTATGLSITPTNSQTAGNVYGINIGALTPGAATEIALNIGAGWDQGIVIASGNNDGTGFVYSGTGRPTKTITLSAEYAGAALTASGSATTVGSMTSDASPSAALSNWQNYYQWTSTQTSLQDYTIAVRVTLPKDFSAWATTNPIQIYYNTALTTTNTNKFDLILYSADTSLSAALQSTPIAYKQANVSSVAKTWTTLNLSTADLTSGSVTWNTAGGVATFFIKVYAKDNNYVQIGDIVLTYLSKF